MRSSTPSRPQYPYMGQWDWRSDGVEDRIYLIGAVQTLDLKMRYTTYFPPLTTGSSIVKIFHGANALAYYTAYSFTQPRDGAVAVGFLSERGRFKDQIINRTSHKTQRRNVRRMPYGMDPGRGGSYGS